MTPQDFGLGDAYDKLRREADQAQAREMMLAEWDAHARASLDEVLRSQRLARIARDEALMTMWAEPLNMVALDFRLGYPRIR